MKIGVLTSSRADFGIYLPLLRELSADAFFELEIIAFGTHLSSFHGYTLNEIEKEGFIPRYKIESLMISDSKEAIATGMSLTMMKFSSFWQEHGQNFDLVFCLGDRFEMFAAVMAGIPFQIKFAHIHGGEKTLGAIDNVFRHSISHASKIHFASTQQYQERIMQMVDDPSNVYYTGSLSLDNLSTISLLSTSEFRDKWGIDLSLPTVLTTFHPETLHPELNKQHAEEIVKVVLAANDYQFLITMPNSDTAGNSIRKIFEDRLVKEKRVFLIENLGTKSYFTAIKYCSFILGNSSSGIIEAASFGKYVINLGNRQEGRSCSDNIIHTVIKAEAIGSAISAIEKMKDYTGDNIYYKAGAAGAIINILKTDIHD